MNLRRFLREMLAALSQSSPAWERPSQEQPPPREHLHEDVTLDTLPDHVVQAHGVDKDELPANLEHLHFFHDGLHGRPQPRQRSHWM